VGKLQALKPKTRARLKIRRIFFVFMGIPPK
jgi:hypothetical protein